MKQSTTLVDHQPRSYWIDRAVRSLGARIFGAADAHARRSGWEVTASGRGLGRTYRHPWLDHLVPCPECGGDDAESYAVPACPTCRGTGRILRLPTPAAVGAR